MVVFGAVTIKVIVVGNGGIGKTSLIQKFAKGIFTDTYKKTYPPSSLRVWARCGCVTVFLLFVLSAAAVAVVVSGWRWDSLTLRTIGVDFLEKRMYIPSLGEDATMMLWDTAGQEEFDAVTRSYYRGTCADRR